MRRRRIRVAEQTITRPTHQLTRATDTDTAPATPQMAHHAALQFQQQRGNHAFTRHIQREGEGEFGMSKQADSYAQNAKDYMGTAAANTPFPVVLYEVAQKAVDEVMALGLGMPRPTVIGASLPKAVKGRFMQDSWQLLFNSDMFGMGRTADTLTPAEQQEMVGVVYHEVRHCEQSFKIAQLLAGEGVSVADIAKQLKISTATAQAAKDNPMHAPTWQLNILGHQLNIPTLTNEYLQVKLWKETVVGDYAKYTESIYKLIEHKFSIEQLVKKLRTTDPITEDDQNSLDDMFSLWQNDMADNFKTVKDAINASVIKFTSDTQTLAHIDAIAPKVQAAADSWSYGSEKEAVLRHLAAHIPALMTLVDAAYHDIATEADAHHVGDDAADKFKNLP